MTLTRHSSLTEGVNEVYVLSSLHSTSDKYFSIVVKPLNLKQLLPACYLFIQELSSSLCMLREISITWLFQIFYTIFTSRFFLLN